jgi:hypothetical protein
MATTFNSYVANGSTVLYSFTFPYLETTDIKVTLDGVVTTAYTLANATTIQFNTAPTNAQKIVIYRLTNNDNLKAEFYPGSAIRAADLNDNFQQSLYAVQEVSGTALYRTGDTMSGNLAMGGNRVTGLGTPSASADAATRGYVDGVALAGIVPDGDRGDITVSGTGTVWTVDSGLPASRSSFTQSGTGAVARTVDSKLKDIVSVKDFGAVGDGTTDDTVAIQNAINSSPRNAVYFPRGVYKVTDTLAITTPSYSIVGERTERGQNSQSARSSGNYSAVRINFVPADTTKFLVNIFQATDSTVFLGPFEHKNICFLQNGANGFQFGNESLPVNDGAGGQAYIFNVRFDNCNFEAGTIGSMGSDANGVITLLNRRHIGLAKAFESVIKDCSFFGGDYGVRSYGCDKLNITGCRAYTQRPLDFQGAGSFTVQHTVHDFQTEGWLIAPIRNNGVELAVTNSRFEANVGTPTGYSRFVLPSCTATVTANGATLTFSRTMTNILIPGWSVIELTDGTNTDTCLVTAVSGTSVTVSTENFRFTWSGTATTVTRIHTMGPLHVPGGFGSCYTNISAGAGLNCPAFVYGGGRGAMYLTNCSAEYGAYGNIESLAIGNKASNGQFYMNSQMVFTGCSALLTPSVPSPLIRIVNWNEANGPVDTNNARAFGADSFDSFNKAQRKWIYTPARYSHSGQPGHVFKKVAGDAGTSQTVYAWFLDSTDPSTRYLNIYDNSLPSATSGGIKILIRAKAVSAGSTLSVITSSNLGGETIKTLSLSTSWQTYTVAYGVPGKWGSGGTSSRLLQLYPTADVYLASVVVLDESGAASNSYVNNLIGKILTHKGLVLTSGTGQVVARGSGDSESFKVKAYGINAGGGVDGYASVYGEFIVQTSILFGSYSLRGVSTLYKQKQSVNAGVIDLDLAITAAIVSGSVEITATTTITGSLGGSIAYVYFEIEGLGTQSISLSPS